MKLITVALTVTCVLLAACGPTAPVNAPKTVSNSGPYTWQKNCNNSCATIVGDAFMHEIDSSDCEALHVSVLLMQNAQAYNELGDSSEAGNWHTKERLQAIDDRLVSLNCP